MSPLNPPLTKDDFTNACWQDVVNSSQQRDCLSYDSTFWRKAQEAQKAGNFREQAVFGVLAAVTRGKYSEDTVGESTTLL
jgi:hypothetical protein